eukprot:5560222-Prymnesium_polylepis.1
MVHPLRTRSPLSTILHEQRPCLHCAGFNGRQQARCSWRRGHSPAAQELHASTASLTFTMRAFALRSHCPRALCAKPWIADAQIRVGKAAHVKVRGVCKQAVARDSRAPDVSESCGAAV